MKAPLPAALLTGGFAMEKTAVIFVHGFMGCHRQFEALADFLDDGETEMVFHVLPGHESTLAEFKKTNAKIWQDSVNELVGSMAKQYDRILLVGHSMGGLLAVRASIARPEKVCGVVCIGFPIKINVGKDWLDLNTAASKPHIDGEDPRVTAARTMAGVTITSTGQYLSTLPQNIQFLKTTRLARRDLHMLKAPLTVINFEKDEIVAKSVPEFVKRQKSDTQIIMLPDSYHFLFTEAELVTMADEIRKML
ncbi:MAG: alpha/beta fold hydrolase [Clostridia bacterium]|nr:alpha/beta fold hydrolase [Clostridia bacterium]